MELRKDQPIYLYEEGVSIAGRCAYRLKKKWLYKYLHDKTWL